MTDLPINDNVTVKINGMEVTVPMGTLILDAAEAAGVTIPRFCYQARLSGIGACRICLVEIAGQKKLQPSCITPVMADMDVKTDSEDVENARKGVIEFFLSNHALDCPVCDKGGECELQDMVYDHGSKQGCFDEVKVRQHERDYPLSPVIIKNSNRCVQCTRCVRVCKEVVGRGVLGSVGRGAHQEETSFRKGELDCDHCGMCIEVCPVGCFMRRPYRYTARPWDINGAKTVCSYCSTGCTMTVEERDGVVVRSKASMGGGFNDNLLCSRGRFGYDVMNSKERLTTPLARRNGQLVPIGWDAAFLMLKEAFTRAEPDSVGAIVSARCTNEEAFLVEKLMRTTLGSPNIDSGARWDASASRAFVQAAGITSAGTDLQTLLGSDIVLVCGTQLSDENPVTDYMARCVNAVKRNALIVASPRPMKLDSSAVQTLRHKPAALDAFLTAVSLAMYKNNTKELAAKAGIKAAFAGKKLGSLSTKCGVPEDEITALAGRFERAGSVGILVGTDMLRQQEGFSGLALLKAVVSALGKTVDTLPVLDRCNQRGVWDMGVHPTFGAGYGELPETGVGCGLDSAAMLAKAAEGGLDALYIVGEDVVSTHTDRAIALDAIKNAGFVVVQDSLMTETVLRGADLVLPGAGFAEKSGTFTNQEGRVQCLSSLMPPPGEARADTEIISAIGGMFNKDFPAGDSKAVFEMIRNEVDSYADIELCTENKNSAFVGASASTEPSSKSVPKSTPQAVKPSTEYPYLLITGSHLFHSGELSNFSEILSGLEEKVKIEMSEAAALEMGIKDGDVVRVSTESGKSARFPVSTCRGGRKEVVYIPENFGGFAINSIAGAGGMVERIKINAC